jgi:6,7-dimethyl-8-ribityllumazine synthase
MSEPKDFSKGVTLGAVDGFNLKVTIVRTRWNDAVVSKLVEGCKTALSKCNIKEEDISVELVPGSYEVCSMRRHIFGAT